MWPIVSLSMTGLVKRISEQKYYQKRNKRSKMFLLMETTEKLQNDVWLLLLVFDLCSAPAAQQSEHGHHTEHCPNDSRQ